MSLIKRDMEPAAFILHYSSSDDLLQMGYAPEHSPDTKHYFQPDIPCIFAEHLHQFPVAAESYFPRSVFKFKNALMMAFACGRIPK